VIEDSRLSKIPAPLKLITSHVLTGKNQFPIPSFIATSFLSSALNNADDKKEVRS
jgi:hypothetical protein